MRYRGARSRRPHWFPSLLVAAALIGGLTAARPPAAGGPLGPSCFADDPRVAVPAAPHGMYAWIYNRNALEQLRPVIGKDPTLCGGSIVVYWSDVESQEGRFDFSAVEREAEAFTSKGLRVNFLFSEAGEGATNTVTPAWVLRQVPHVKRVSHGAASGRKRRVNSYALGDVSTLAKQHSVRLRIADDLAPLLRR